MTTDHRQIGLQIDRVRQHRGIAPGVRHRVAQPLKFRHREPDHPARAVAAVEQALDDAQLVDLLGRIGPLAEGVALGHGVAVAPLPDAQRVLAEAGLALDRGDRQQRRQRDGGARAHRGTRPGTRPRR
jgi:hypothetical protein